MSKPVLYAISAFDATKEHIFTFSYSGEQIISTHARIYNNETGAIVYTGTCETSKPYFILPAGAISNSNVPYNIDIRVRINADDIAYSEYSDKVQFWCITTPTFVFNGLSAASVNTIRDSSYNLSLQYVPADGETEQLDSYEYFLYNNLKNTVDTSGVFYALGKSFVLSYLLDDANYYVRATGITQNGMKLDTGYVPIYVHYEVNNTYLAVDPTNRFRYGDILVKSNIVSVDGWANPEPEKYITMDDTKAQMTRIGVDLMDDGSFVVFDENFVIPENFDMELILMKFKPNRKFITISGKDAFVELYMAQRKFNDDESIYTYVILLEKTKMYTVQSNRIVYDGTSFLTVSLKCANGLYEAKLTEGANVDTEIKTASEVEQ